MADTLAEAKAEIRRLRRENARLHKMALEYRWRISKAEHLGWMRGKYPENSLSQNLRNRFFREIGKMDEQIDEMQKHPETCVILLRSEYKQFQGKLAEANVQAVFTETEGTNDATEREKHPQCARAGVTGQNDGSEK